MQVENEKKCGFFFFQVWNLVLTTDGLSVFWDPKQIPSSCSSLSRFNTRVKSLVWQVLDLVCPLRNMCTG